MRLPRFFRRKARRIPTAWALRHFDETGHWGIVQFDAPGVCWARCWCGWFRWETDP